MAQLNSDANALAQDLAERFDDLAKRDSSLRARSNCIGECCTFQLHSNDAKRVAEQTFRRLAREAAELLGLQQDPRGPEVPWLRLLFESDGVVHTRDVVPVTLRRGGVDEAAVARFREIDNAAEASALVLRRVAREAIQRAAIMREAVIGESMDDSRIHSATDLANPADAAQSSKAQKVDGKEIRSRLERIAGLGIAFKSMQASATELDCGKTTIHDAIHSSAILRKWASVTEVGSPTPRAVSLTDAVLDDASAARTTTSSEYLPEEDVDVAMAKLINEAAPKERARLNALNREEQRALVREVNRQCLDFEADPFQAGVRNTASPGTRSHKRV